VLSILVGTSVCSATDPVVGSGYSSAAAFIEGEQIRLINTAISELETLAATGDWPDTTLSQELRPGLRHEDVRTLRKILQLTGDFDGYVNADPLLFDATLSNVLKHFQARHGLDTSGLPDRLTRLALSRSPAEKVQHLKKARTAWIEIPAYDRQKLVWVNIPETRVSAIADSKVELNLPAIVGQPSRPTPTLFSNINRLIVNPGWSVPDSIARQDLLPEQQENPEYFAENNIRVFRGWAKDSKEIDPATVNWESLSEDRFPYRLQQDAGINNALGRYKFSFPNEHDIFLHDTPAKKLLGLSYRSLSSGCVRMDQPEALARWLLQDPAPLDAALAEDPDLTQGLSVSPATPVAFVYLIAWVENDGTVHLRNDIYSLNNGPIK